MKSSGRIFAIGLLVLGAAAFGLVGARAAGINSSGEHAALAGNVQATATPTAAATPQTLAGPPASIELIPLPEEIICDGRVASRLQVRVRDALGAFVNEGTPVYFGGVGGGFASPTVATTLHGVVETGVGAQGSASDPFRPFSIQVDVGRLEATIRILCVPPGTCLPLPTVPSNTSPPPPTATPCIPATSPPQCSPFSPPQSPPCPGACSPFVSPPQAFSPPCVPQPPSPPPCQPASPPQSPQGCPPRCVPGSTSPPCVTATPLPGCSPFVAVSPPCVSPTATPIPCNAGAAVSPPCGPGAPPCADVTGDGAVTFLDSIALTAQIRSGQQNPRYDLNRDGVVDLKDLRIVTAQLGRRC